MKASEMTNDELASFFEKNSTTILRCTRCGDETPISDFFASRFREAAARLRKIDTYATINERQDIENAKLRAELKRVYRVLWNCASAGWECENCRRDCGLHKMGIVKMPNG